MDMVDLVLNVTNIDAKTGVVTKYDEVHSVSKSEIEEMSSRGIRHERDNRLVTEVDPIVSNALRWAEMTAEKQAEWAQYRTDLLNVPDQAGFPTDITWPTKPE